MDFTICNYNYSFHNFTTCKRECCLGLLHSSELLVMNFLRTVVNWTLARTGSYSNWTVCSFPFIPSLPTEYRTPFWIVTLLVAAVSFVMESLPENVHSALPPRCTLLKRWLAMDVYSASDIYDLLENVSSSVIRIGSNCRLIVHRLNANNWEESASGPVWSIILTDVWSHRWRLRMTSARIVGVPANIGTRHFKI
jgi:hypothetical protein